MTTLFCHFSFVIPSLLWTASLLLPQQMVTNLSDMDDRLRMEFIASAPLAWQQFDRLSENCIVNLENEFVENGEAVRTFSKVVKRKPNHLVVTTLTRNKNGEETHRKALGINNTYSFLLNGHKTGVWSSELIGPTSDPNIEKQIYYQRVDGWCSYSPTWLFREKLAEIVRQPYFSILNIKSIDSEGRQLVELEFDYTHPYETLSESGKQFNWVQGGRIVFDPANFWTIQNATIRMEEGGGNPEERYMTDLCYRYDKAQAGRNLSLPVECTRINRPTSSDWNTSRDSAKTWGSKISFEFQIVDSKFIADEEFRLPKFGLPEYQVKSQPTPFWLYAIGVGVFFIVSATLVNYYCRRTNDQEK